MKRRKTDALTPMAWQMKTLAPSARQCHLEHEDNPRDRTIASITRVMRPLPVEKDEEALNPAERGTMELPRGLH